MAREMVERVSGVAFAAKMAQVEGVLGPLFSPRCVRCEVGKRVSGHNQLELFAALLYSCQFND